MNVIYAVSGNADMNSIRQEIMDIAGIGFDGVLADMALCCPEKGLHNFTNPLLQQCERNGIRTLTARAPYLHRNAKQEDLEELLTRLAGESIQFCGDAGCQYLIVRPLFAGITRGEEWEVNRKYYLSLVDEARKNNVTILLENQCRDINGHLVRGICADVSEAAAWVDRLNEAADEERFGFCMDAGACSLCGQNMREFAVMLGSRIKAVILRDCDGHYEASMLPFTCVTHGQPATDWLGLIRGLRQINFDGSLIMDFSSTTAAFSLLLRPQLLLLAKAVADYFKWQISMKNILKKYDTRVLFGAGNMCRNYMKCYGDEFPPLFTCDNNKNRWGGWFEGLEIKPPEALRELPPNCAVFICNIYYREIDQQLREMGISNPIEYFNDEYMPSFYFDRINMEERG